jgi:hypothetical protein
MTMVGVVGNIDCDAVDKAIDLVRAELIGLKIPLAPRGPGLFTYDDLQDAVVRTTKLTALRTAGATALYFCSDPVLTAKLHILVQEAKNRGMETMHEIKEAHGHNGDQTYGPNFPFLFKKAAEKANQILRGTNAGTIPVYAPSDTQMVQDPP